MIPFLFELKKLLAFLILPPLFPLILIVIGLSLINRYRKLGIRIAWFGVLVSALLIFPASVSWLLGGLETAPPLDTDSIESAQAIVIVGGGTRGYAPEFGGPTVNRLTLERLRYGAKLAKETGLPILVSGGAPTGGIPESQLMQHSLETDFATSIRWREDNSRDTRENARLSAPLLQADGINTILLVTHAAHMTRTREEFESQGFQVIPAPTAWLGHPGGGESVLYEVPTGISAFAGWFAAHEWLGLIAYRLSRE